MGVISTARLLIYISLCQIVLVSWYVAASGVCPEKCNCTPFGSKRFIVRCKGINQVPNELPVNTSMLDLSGNFLKAVPQEIFRNMNMLKIINLNENSIEDGFRLPESVTTVKMRGNRLSLKDLKIILAKAKRVNYLDISGNPIGPNLTMDVFAGLEKMFFLNISNCGLNHIQGGTFRAMKDLFRLQASYNMLTHIQPATLEGLGDKLSTLDLYKNALVTIADGTFVRFQKLRKLELSRNQLKSTPDFSGPINLFHLSLKINQIKDISPLGNSNLKHFFALRLNDNQIERLPTFVFQTVSVSFSLDLSFNNLHSLPDGAFSACSNLSSL